jgi:niacin transporter
MENKKVSLIVVAGLLCAVGLVIPMVMPKVVLGPMSFTLASHVPIFLAMFISPSVALAVCLGTTLGFFMTTPLIIAMRAASHIVFALVGAIVIRKNPQIIEKPVSTTIFNFFLALLHAAAEVVVVTPFFFTDYMFKPEQLAAGYVTSVLFLVGGGTFIHSLIDYSIALFIWKPLVLALPALKRFRS